MRHGVFKKIGRAIGTWKKKKHTLCFDIAQILSVFLEFFKQNMGLCYNLDSCF